MGSIPLEWLVGPVAGLAIALTAARVLWLEHKAADKRERDRTDALEARLNAIIDVLRKAASK